MRSMIVLARFVIVLGVLHLASPATGVGATEARAAGVVVEAVESYGAGALAGFEAGDEIVACAQSGREWQTFSPFDLAACEWELAPRGPVTLTVSRDGATRSVEIEQGSWDLRTRPRLSDAWLQRFTAARAASEDGGGTESEHWSTLEDELWDAGRVVDAVWLALIRVETLRKTGTYAAAEGVIERLLGRDEVVLDPRLTLAVREAERLLLRASAAPTTRHVTNAEALVAAADRLTARPLIAPRMRYRLALAQHYGGQRDAARVTVARAIEHVERHLPSPNPLRGALLAVIGAIELAEQRYDAAEIATREAIGLLENARPVDTYLAWAIGNWGIIQARRKDDEGAMEAYARQTAIYDRRGDVMLASITHVNAALAAERLGDFARADGLLERALQGIDPDALQGATVFGNRAYLHLSWGRLASAETYAERSHAVLSAFAIDNARLGRSLARLGHIARYRGDLEAAEDRYTRALAIYQRLGDARGMRLHRSNLGNLARQRGDYATALAFYRQSLDGAPIIDATDARVLSNVGRTLLLLDRSDDARPYLEQSLAIKRQEASETLDVAASLMLLGDLERGGARWQVARDLYRQALEMHSRLVPGRPAEAENQMRLAALELEVGAPARAKTLLAAAVATLERRAPGTDLAADALYQLGRLQRQGGDRNATESLFRRSIDALDDQWRSLGGAPVARLSWMHDRADIYRDYVSLLVEDERPTEAFRVLQRYRAHAVRGLRAGRRLDLPRTGRAREIEHQLTDLARRREDLLGQLAGVDASTDIEASLARLSAERVPLRAALDREAPRLAAVTYPVARTATDIVATLAADEVVVSYVVGRDRTFAFALSGRTGAAPAVARIDISLSRLQADVEAFRDAIVRRDPAQIEALHRQADALYDRLLAPLESVIDGARRLTIAPDGPLHRVPFAVLRQAGRYLIEERTLRITPSATALVSSRAGAGASAGASASAVTGRGAVAFADPQVGAAHARAADGVSTKAALLRDRSLRPLPASRLEVEAVRGALPPPVEVLIGAAATEERAKRLAGERYVHFAGHALVDERSPLDSALVLARPHVDVADDDRGEKDGDGENGLLYAWEVLEQLQLDASLVTLSACETALGGDNAAAGILGFVWAFRSAGARSVLASLWAVEDRSTSVLMAAFYRALANGQDKDSALRAAQLAVLRQPQPFDSDVASSDATRGVGGLTASPATTATHPFYWAAFQLYGATEP